MNRSLKQSLHRALGNPEQDASPETLERVGCCIAQFMKAARSGADSFHPEAFIIELPIQDHETARKCFDMLRVLQELHD